MASRVSWRSRSREAAEETAARRLTDRDRDGVVRADPELGEEGIVPMDERGDPSDGIGDGSRRAGGAEEDATADGKQAWMQGTIGLRAGCIEKQEAVGPEELAEAEGIPWEGRAGLLAKDAGHLGTFDQLEGWLLGEFGSEEVREFSGSAGCRDDGNAEWGSRLGVEETWEEEDDA
jgi:hypothetical protein